MDQRHVIVAISQYPAVHYLNHNFHNFRSYGKPHLPRSINVCTFFNNKDKKIPLMCTSIKVTVERSSQARRLI